MLEVSYVNFQHSLTVYYLCKTKKEPIILLIVYK